MKILVFGGSFDPIHEGHAVVASYASQCGVADEVWLLPNAVNPLKTATQPAPDADRLAMCELIAASLPAVKVCDVEIHNHQPHYTYDTLRKLGAEYPQHEFRLLIGSDNWLIFDKWKNSEKIIAEFAPVIYPRPGYPVVQESLPAGVSILEDAPMVLLSSSFIREWKKSGHSLLYIVPDNVREYIEERKLYE
ncbi:MAG: nicotinate (nicotinamide) nucleotide adenylyltransferase [Muribaculaceae bacterium]|nr:nicotinate (nicotinamide) nucleotide adenylyltransferase [Muribaculaceae bacterium]